MEHPGRQLVDVWSTKSARCGVVSFNPRLAGGISMRKLAMMLLLPIAVALVISFSESAPVIAADPGHGDGLAAGEQSGSADHEAEHPTGAPLNPKADLALWSLVVFVVFVLVLKKVAWKPLLEGLDRREGGIRADIEDAEKARRESERMLAEHAAKLEQVQDEVREILAEARRDAERTRQELVEAAGREAEATRRRAIEEIGRARDAALTEMFDRSADIVAAATEHVLGRALSPEDQSRLIDEALSQFAET